MIKASGLQTVDLGSIPSSSLIFTDFLLCVLFPGAKKRFKFKSTISFTNISFQTKLKLTTFSSESKK